MQGLRAAMVFLTRLPAGRVAEGAFAAAPGWFAAVGLLLGAVQAGVLAGAAVIWGPGIAALLALAAGMALTGALHEDGLADTFDALGAPRAPARALEILRDSRIGTFGALALAMGLGLQALALTGLSGAGIGTAAAALIAAQALSRAPMAAMLRHGPYLRANGTGSAFTGALAPTARLAWWATLLAGLGLAAWALGWGAGPALAGTLSGVVLIWVWARRRLGGVTGDIIGAAQQAGFTGFLLGALAWLQTAV